MFDHFPGLAWPAPYGTMLVLAGIMSWRLARRRVAAMAIDASHVDLALPLSLALGAAAAWGLDAAIPQESQLAGEQLQLERRLRLPLLAMAALPVLLAYCRVVGVPFRCCRSRCCASAASSAAAASAMWREAPPCSTR